LVRGWPARPTPSRVREGRLSRSSAGSAVVALIQGILLDWGHERFGRESPNPSTRSALADNFRDAEEFLLVTVFLGLVLYVSSVTDVPDEVRFW
jgi:hypothetical protein